MRIINDQMQKKRKVYDDNAEKQIIVKPTTKEHEKPSDLSRVVDGCFKVENIEIKSGDALMENHPLTYVSLSPEDKQLHPATLALELNIDFFGKFVPSAALLANIMVYLSESGQSDLLRKFYETRKGMNIATNTTIFGLHHQIVHYPSIYSDTANTRVLYRAINTFMTHEPCQEYSGNLEQVADLDICIKLLGMNPNRFIDALSSIGKSSQIMVPLSESQQIIEPVTFGFEKDCIRINNLQNVSIIDYVIDPRKKELDEQLSRRRNQ